MLDNNLYDINITKQHYPSYDPNIPNTYGEYIKSCKIYIWYYI